MLEAISWTQDKEANKAQLTSRIQSQGIQELKGPNR